MQCDMVVSWKIGHQYKFDVSKKGNLVTGVVTNMMNEKKRLSVSLKFQIHLASYTHFLFLLKNFLKEIIKFHPVIW
nr:hypothetical protein [Bartonella ancashensis]